MLLNLTFKIQIHPRIEKSQSISNIFQTHAPNKVTPIQTREFWHQNNHQLFACPRRNLAVTAGSIVSLRWRYSWIPLYPVCTLETLCESFGPTACSCFCLWLWRSSFSAWGEKKTVEKCGMKNRTRHIGHITWYNEYLKEQMWSCGMRCTCALMVCIKDVHS